jgi:hypothetical protein
MVLLLGGLTLRVSRAAGGVVERDREREGKAAKVAPRLGAAPAASCCTRLFGLRAGKTVIYGVCMQNVGTENMCVIVLLC